MTMAGYGLFVLIICITGAVGNCENENGVSGFMDLNYLLRKLRTLDEQPTDDRSGVYPLQEQLRIVDSNRFSCNGQIIGFNIGASVKSATASDTDNTGYPRVIIWRRRSDDRRRRRDDDEVSYSMQGSMELRPSFSDLQPHSGMYQYLLPHPLTIRPQDVFGVYQPSPLASTVTLHYTNSTSSLIGISDSVAYVDYGTTLITIPDQVSQNSQRLKLVTKEYLLIQPIFETTLSGLTCAEGFLDTNLIANFSLKIGNLETPTDEIRLFPDITFTQSGYITSWTIGGMEIVNDASTPSESQRLIELQIWRLIPPDKTTYLRIESYNLPKPQDDHRSAFDPRVYEFPVSPPMQIMAGDILGIYQPSTARPLKLYFQNCNGPNNLYFHHTADLRMPNELTTSTLHEDGSNDYPLVVANVSLTNDFSSSISTADSKTKANIIITQTLLPSSTLVLSSSLHSNNVRMSRISAVVPSVSNDTTITTLITGTRTVMDSQQSPPLAAESVDSNEALLIGLTSVGSVLILITIPAIVVSLIIVIRNMKRGHKIIYASPINHTSSSGAPAESRTRESMHYNPMYYMKRIRHPLPPPPVQPAPHLPTVRSLREEHMAASVYLTPVPTIRRQQQQQQHEHQPKHEPIYEEIHSQEYDTYV